MFMRAAGPAAPQQYLALGAPRCVSVPDALDPASHFPEAPRKEWAADLALLAGRGLDPGRVDELFLRPARLVPERRFILAGDGQAPAGLPENVRAVGALDRRDHNAFHASARAVLDLAPDATHLFEAAGAAACLISARDGIEELLAPGREVLVAADGDDVARHLRQLGN